MNYKTYNNLTNLLNFTMMKRLRKWLFSLIALTGLVLLLNPIDAVGQQVFPDVTKTGIQDFNLSTLDECTKEVKNTQVNLTYDDFEDIFECESTSTITFTLSTGGLYYPGVLLDYKNPEGWDEDYEMVSGSNLLFGGDCIDFEGDDHDLGQTGYQVWVYWWNELDGKLAKTKKYQIDI
ncbi:MAG: hypothetical protein KAI29_30970, partial [Cyclobacteriaceae bacterium]|nr:hypothetical protein [Cyclobacteriaceae bacterium]